MGRRVADLAGAGGGFAPLIPDRRPQRGSSRVDAEVPLLMQKAARVGCLRLLMQSLKSRKRRPQPGSSRVDAEAPLLMQKAAPLGAAVVVVGEPGFEPGHGGETH